MTEENITIPQEPISNLPPTEIPTPVQAEPPVIESTPTPVEIVPAPVLPPQSPVQPIQPSPKSFLAKALEKIQFRKRAKLDKIMKFAQDKKSITNDQVEKLLHVSDATATRYLSELVKQNRLKRTGLPQNPRYEPLDGSNGGN